MMRLDLRARQERCNESEKMKEEKKKRQTGRASRGSNTFPGRRRASTAITGIYGRYGLRTGRYGLRNGRYGLHNGRYEF
jgi:hypothetical protein